MFFFMVVVLALFSPGPQDGGVAADSIQVSQQESQPVSQEDSSQQRPAGQKPAQEPAVEKSEDKGEQTPQATAADPVSTPNPPPGRVHKRRGRAKKMPADGEPRKVVIHHGGTSEPVADIVPGMGLEEANRQREKTIELLAAADGSLHELAAVALDANQEEMVIQIRQYMDGARVALKDSDTQRAHTLALKARLLADDMAKHK